MAFWSNGWWFFKTRSPICPEHSEGKVPLAQFFPANSSCVLHAWFFFLFLFCFIVKIILLNTFFSYIGKKLFHFFSYLFFTLHFVFKVLLCTSFWLLIKVSDLAFLQWLHDLMLPKENNWLEVGFYVKCIQSVHDASHIPLWIQQMVSRPSSSASH